MLHRHTDISLDRFWINRDWSAGTEEEEDDDEQELTSCCCRDAEGIAGFVNANARMRFHMEFTEH